MLAGISAVERDTGLSKDTLRMWERRYGFPDPQRDSLGERVYAAAQVEKLRVIKRLMDRGMRPGKLMRQSLEDLLALGSGSGDGDAAERVLAPEMHAMLALLRSHRVSDLRRALARTLARQGLGRFVTAIAVPLNRAVGEAWMRGELAVFEEHLYSESLQIVLRAAIAAVPQDASSPRVLLTTLPGEQHGLGLLLAEALLALEGAQCLSLGVETPVADIASAAVAQSADIVALSFSGAYPVQQMSTGLGELRAHLDKGIALWAGSAAGALGRRPPQGVLVLSDLGAIHAALADWRALHANGD